MGASYMEKEELYTNAKKCCEHIFKIINKTTDKEEKCIMLGSIISVLLKVIEEKLPDYKKSTYQCLIQDFNNLNKK